MCFVGCLVAFFKWTFVGELIDLHSVSKGIDWFAFLN